MINFGKVIIDQTKAGSETVNYEGSSKPTFTISSSKSTCTAVTTSITPILPVSQTLYFGENGRVVDANGDFYLTNQGYGVLGTTDANGVLTVNTLVPAVSITAPLSSAEYEIGDTVTITWTSSNIATLDLFIESATGSLTVEDIDASLGTYDVTLTADTGSFNANQDITISLTDCIGVATDSVDIVSIATIAMYAIGNQTAGVAFNVAGTTNLHDGDKVEVFAGATSKGDATVASGAFTKSVTIDDPANDVIIKVQDKLNANANDTETINVASGTYKFQITNFECNFTPYDSIAIGTKLAIMGKIENASTIAKLGGKALVANATMALILFDPATSVVDWAYSVNTGYDDAPYYVKLRADSTHIYFATNANGTAKKLDLYKIAISNGAGTVQNLSNLGGIDGNKMCQVVLDSTNVYVAHLLDSYKIGVYKRLKSDLSAVTNATIKTFTGSEYINTYLKLDMDIDENYLYYAFTYYDGAKYQHQIARTAFDLTGYTEIRKDYGFSGATPANTHGYGIEKIGSAIIANNRDLTPNLYWVGDGTTETEVSALMTLQKQSNSQLFLFQTVTTKKINTTTYATTWTKDYTADAVATCCKVEYVGSSYYLIGSTTGDFDGNHAGNTSKNAIIGKINISTGNL